MISSDEGEGARVLAYKGRGFLLERGSNPDTTPIRCERNTRYSRSIQLGSYNFQIPRDVARPADRRCENSVQGSSQRVCPRRTLGCVRSGL